MKLDSATITYIITAIIIVFGAIVHAIAKLKVDREKNDETFTFLDYIILVPLAMFSGFFFAMTATFFVDDSRAIYLAASLGSFLGIAGMNKIANVILDLLVEKIKDRK